MNYDEWISLRVFLLVKAGPDIVLCALQILTHVVRESRSKEGRIVWVSLEQM